MDNLILYKKCLSKPALILFMGQLFLIITTVVVSLVNLTLNTSNKILWTMLLSSCLGYIMPNPKLKYVEIDKCNKKVSLSNNSTPKNELSL